MLLSLSIFLILSMDISFLAVCVWCVWMDWKRAAYHNGQWQKTKGNECFGLWFNVYVWILCMLQMQWVLVKIERKSVSCAHAYCTLNRVDWKVSFTFVAYPHNIHSVQQFHASFVQSSFWFGCRFFTKTLFFLLRCKTPLTLSIVKHSWMACIHLFQTVFFLSIRYILNQVLYPAFILAYFFFFFLSWCLRYHCQLVLNIQAHHRARKLILKVAKDVRIK